MSRAQCYAYDHTTRLRCTRPGGHAGAHTAKVTWEDDTTWVPVLSGEEVVELAASVERHPAGLSLVPEAGAQVEQAQAGACVACGHLAEHLDPEQAGDNAGCQHPECMCLTAVRV